MDLKLFFRLKNQEEERESKRFNIVLLEEKETYSNFVKKLLQLENLIERKRRKKKFAKFQEKYPFALCSIDQMNR